MKASDPDSDWTPKLIDLGKVEGAFTLRDGYSRPAWRIIAQAIERAVEPQDLNAAWKEVAMQWVLELRSDLGSGYRVAHSREFILLSELSADVGRQILAFAEGALRCITARLKDAARKSGYGKHVILLFSEEDDYYQYVAYFHRDGLHPRSGGCLITKDYDHIAAPCQDGMTLKLTLAHELAHSCVVHLPLPLWLNEGLAVVFQRAIVGSLHPVLDHDLRERHLAFWQKDNIQTFWSGLSFAQPGDSNELSYSLAEIMVNLMSEQKGDWAAFLQHAHWGDAGQTAAIDCLGVDLGEVMSRFLGTGDWRPRRKALVNDWEAAREASTSDGAGSGSR